MSDTMEPAHLPDLKAGVYRHYKGDDYLVLGYAHDAADMLYRGEVNKTSGEIDFELLEHRHLVVYVPLYLAGGPRIAVRDVDDFFGTVETDLGPVPRFAFVRSG